MTDINAKINQRLLEILNNKNYTMAQLKKISHEKLKEILSEIYKEFHTLGNIENSQKQNWKRAAEEVIKKSRESEEANSQKEEHTNKDVEDEKKDDQLSSEDYDDLIQPEFPKEYNEQIHDKRIENLLEKLDKERGDEIKSINQFEQNKNNLFKAYFEELEKNKSKNKGDADDLNNKDRIKETNDKRDEKEDDKLKNELKIKIAKEEEELNKKIKANTHMKNDEFLLLLCLMRKKKEQKFENNPYIVDFSVNLDTVYQSKRKTDNEEAKELIAQFEADLNKYVD